jgi:hypothetical protein
VCDVDVDAHCVRAGGVRGDHVRGSTHPDAAGRDDLLDELEQGELRDEGADGGAAQVEPLGELSPGQSPVAMDVAEDQRQIVLPDVVSADRP